MLSFKKSRFFSLKLLSCIWFTYDCTLLARFSGCYYFFNLNLSKLLSCSSPNLNGTFWTRNLTGVQTSSTLQGSIITMESDGNRKYPPQYQNNYRYFSEHYVGTRTHYNAPNPSGPQVNRSFSDTTMLNANLSSVSFHSGGSNDNADSLHNKSKIALATERDLEIIKTLRYWQITKLGKSLERRGCGQRGIVFTIMNYNVLAQELLAEHPQLYRKQSPTVLLWENRWHNLLNEIKEHNADIVCLQEVQASHWLFYNELTKIGYGNIFKQRTGNRTDGCAIFYKTQIFKLIEYTTVEFHQPNIAVLDRDNIAIVAKFAPVNNLSKEFIVATTHLLYNPRRQDVRLAQTQVLLTEIDRMAFKIVNNTNKYLPVIMTGDLNSTPDSAVLELISRGTVVYENLAKRTLQKTNSSSNKNGKELISPHLRITDQCKHAYLLKFRAINKEISRWDEEKLIGLTHSQRYGANESSQDMKELFSTGTLSHDLALLSCYKHRRNNDQEASTFQDEWVTVDYIFYSGEVDGANSIKEKKIKLIAHYVLPTRQELKSISIPNYALGSDHLSLLAKFLLEY